MLKSRNKQIYEEASEWLVELRVGDMDAPARERLDTWFRESPHHIRAFLELSSIWEEGGDPDLDRDNSIDALITRARASTNVIALQDEGVAARESHRGSKNLHRRWSFARFFSWPSAVMASVILACLAGGLLALDSYLSPNYATGTGEQRTVHLSDGSTIELNSKSRVRVLFSERERDVELAEGQALFHVAKDHTRPFIVSADGTRVRAVGTQFDVYRKSSGTVVTVVEGRVAVFVPLTPNPSSSGRERQNSSPPAPLHASGEGRVPRSRRGEATQLPGEASSFSSPTFGEGAQGAGEVFVSTGEQVTVTDQGVPEPRRADVRAVTAWTKRELVFDMTPLAQVAQEFNRYNTRKLVVSDSTLGDFHVTGIFSSTDPASLLRFLRAQRGIEVVEAGKEIRVSKK